MNNFQVGRNQQLLKLLAANRALIRVERELDVLNDIISLRDAKIRQLELQLAQKNRSILRAAVDFFKRRK